MNRFLLPAIAIGAVFLAGCTKTIEEMGYAERMKLAQEISNRCDALGLKPGSPQSIQCIKTEVEKERYTRIIERNRQEQARMALASGMQSMGNSLSNAPRPVSCTARTYKGITTANCY